MIIRRKLKKDQNGITLTTDTLLYVVETGLHHSFHGELVVVKSALFSQ